MIVVVLMNQVIVVLMCQEGEVSLLCLLHSVKPFVAVVGVMVHLTLALTPFGVHSRTPPSAHHIVVSLQVTRVTC
jgi:hypothetical protein